MLRHSVAFYVQMTVETLPICNPLRITRIPFHLLLACFAIPDVNIFSVSTFVACDKARGPVVPAFLIPITISYTA